MLTRLIDVRGREVVAVLWSFLYGFCMLSSYMILRPVRDAIAGQLHPQTQALLLVAILPVMLVAVPLFGWVSARFSLRAMLPAVYGFFILHLLGFYAVFELTGIQPVAAGVFFVWVSVFNLFIVSVFWSFMVDLYTEEQSKRLFGLISASVTCGAIAGPALTASLVKVLGVSNLLLVSGGLLALAVGCILQLTVWSRRQQGAGTQPQHDTALGGSAWAGLRDICRSSYLLGICASILCYTTLGTILYLEQQRLVKEAQMTTAERTQLFANIDLTVSLSSLLIQSLLTALLARFSVTCLLALLPAVALAGFAVLASFPMLAAIIAATIVYRVGEFALSKPGREMLFTLVPREEKYKAKNAIDTLVYRGGDAAAGGMVWGLRDLGMGLSGLSFVALPFAAIWIAVAFWLGGRHRQMLRQAKPSTATEQAARSDELPAPVSAPPPEVVG
jgi:AAA family ATP:ADP antiporter